MLELPCSVFNSMDFHISLIFKLMLLSEKKGLKLIICIFHGLLNPNNGTMTSTENSNRVC